MTTEPVIGNPKEMAEAIAEALNLVDKFRRYVHKENDWEEIGLYASDVMQEIEWALEDYTED